jgi:hypothetical protein
MQKSWRSIAESQYGVITRAQALEAGLSPSGIHRYVKSQVLEPAHYGTYLVRGAPSSWRQRVMAVVLSCPGSVACCRTAGALYGLQACSAREIEILVTRSARRRAHGVIVRETNYLADSDIADVGGIPCTGPARTLLDLGAVMDHDRVRLALEDAFRKGLVNLVQLQEQLLRAGRKGRAGTATLRALLDSNAPLPGQTESPLEEELLRVINACGLPPPRTQFEVWENGLLIARVDAAYPDLRIGIEADGYEWHSAPPDWLRDRRRQNALVSRDWTILRFCLEDAFRPAQFTADLQRAYVAKMSF